MLSKFFFLNFQTSSHLSILWGNRRGSHWLLSLYYPVMNLLCQLNPCDKVLLSPPLDPLCPLLCLLQSFPLGVLRVQQFRPCSLRKYVLLPSVSRPRLGTHPRLEAVGEQNLWAVHGERCLYVPVI